MRSFEIFVAPEPQMTPALLAIPDGVRTTGASRLAREVLDVFIGGANVTARVGDTQAGCVLRDLGAAVAELSRRARGKAIVRFYDEPWEMCVERLGGTAALSVYRAGAEPEIAVYDRLVAWSDVRESVGEAISTLIAREESEQPRRTPLSLELKAAEQALSEASGVAVEEDLAVEETPIAIEIDRDAPISFSAEFAIRSAPSQSCDPSVERADLHALLFRGKMRAEIRGRAVELPDGHPFLFAERILDLGRRALDAWERGVPYHVRAPVGGVLLGLRLGEAGHLALTLGQTGAGPAARTAYTFPALGVPDVLEAALGFGRALVRALLRRDRSQCTNLRLSAFRRKLRETSDALREACREDTKINPSPESYRVFVTGSSPPPAASPPAARALPSTRLRYASRWRAIVPGIDLRGTFLCGDRLIVSGAHEMFCLERKSGDVLWRIDTDRATSVVTPGGIARLGPCGSLRVHDFGNGEVTLQTKLVPRTGGPVSGAVVSGHGLPRLLIVTEGESHLVAVDLMTGEPRWRFTWGKTEHRGKAGAPRMKRAGKLLYFTSGDSALTALDVQTGAVVWRARDRLRFRAAPTLDHEALFAVAGGASCLAKLHSIDAFSGHVRWSCAVGAAVTVEGSPLAGRTTVAVAVRERSTLRLVARDRETGAERWSSRGAIAPAGTSWLAVDDLFIGNTPSGEVVGVSAATGELRYRRVLGPRVLDSDVPRRLEPVLRCGALFVPHADVHVLRPQDGEELGVIAPCAAIPDLLRVDERCDVYVAEESGHLVSFSALPRLSLVRG